MPLVTLMGEDRSWQLIDAPFKTLFDAPKYADTDYAVGDLVELTDESAIKSFVFPFTVPFIRVWIR